MVGRFIFWPAGKRFSWLPWLVVFVLAGCRSLSLPATTLAPVVPTSQPAGAATSTPSPAPRPTFTATPKPTQTPSPTPAPPTATPTPAPVRFAVIGDYGMAGPDAAAVAALVLSWEPDFIITTGDNNYPSGAAETIDANVGQYYHTYIAPYQGSYDEGASENRFFSTLGNHDWNTAAAQAYLDYFTLPGNERYYDFTWGPLHLFALDSDSREPDGVSASSPQALWLRDGLAAAREPWKVVYMHHPPYSSGLHGSIVWMQWPFREWGATLVLASHDHLYERLVIDGLPYVINGLGGSGRYPFQAPLPGSQVRFNDDYGALLVEATASKITFQFVTRAGVVVDRFSLTAP